MIDDKTLIVYTVYDHPKDYPNSFVVKRDFITDGNIIRDLSFTIIGPDLDEIRKYLSNQGLFRMRPMSGDDPVIKETWI